MQIDQVTFTKASHPPHIVGLGQCSWDILGRIEQFPVVDTKTELLEVVEQGGGPVATALVTLSRLGCRATMLGVIGNDPYGKKIRQGLEDESVDCSLLQNDGRGESQWAFIAIEADTGNRNIFWTRGEKRPFSLGPEEKSTISRADFLHLDGLDDVACFEAATLARQKGIPTMLDGGTCREGTMRLLPLIDHLVVSERFAHQICGDKKPAATLKQLSSFGASSVTVTCGAGGSWTWESNEASFFQPAFPVKAIDTTGCGDVFHGGYLFGLLQQWPLKKTLRFAAACAALKTRAMGGRTAIPTIDEVECFLKEH